MNASGLQRDLNRFFLRAAGVVAFTLLSLSGPARSAAAAAQLVPPAPLRLSLNQALEMGLDRSLALRSSRLSVAESRAVVGLTKARFLPHVDLVGLSTYGQVGTSIGFISNLSTIGDLNLGVGADGYAVVQNTFVNLGLTLTVPLIDFSRGPLQQAAGADLQAARAEQLEQQRRSRFEITSAYLNAQLAEALIPVWQRSLAVSGTLLRDATAIRRQGLAARIDTLQAEALLQTDRQGLAEAEAQRQVALSGLARVLNLAPDQQLSLSDPLTPGPGWPLPLGPTLQRSLQQRPLLDALDQQRRAQLARVELARASRRPSIGLLLGAGINGDWLSVPVLNTTQQLTAAGRSVDLPLNSPGSFSGSFYDWGAVIGLRQPLFDGGLSRESTTLAQRRAEQSDVAIDQARQTIVQSVQTWWASHQAAGPQMTAAAAAAAAGEQAVRDALLRYRAGIAPLTELLVAQRNLQLARASQAAATHRWNLSHAGLELETGGASTSGPLPTVP